MGFLRVLRLTCAGALCLLGACDKLKGSSAAPSSSATAAAGCAADKDCKGDRVCVDGKCSEPKAAAPAAQTAQTAAKTATASASASGETTGVPECDEYLAKLTSCGHMPADQLAKLRETYKNLLASGAKDTVADGCKKGAAAFPPGCGDAAAAGSGESCKKQQKCCRAITLNPVADARLNVRIGTATREDTLKSCDELITAPANVCDNVHNSVREAMAKLPAATQNELAADCNY